MAMVAAERKAGADVGRLDRLVASLNLWRARENERET
ncbi:hypothetical protein DF3PB_1520007 [uncultured Defluviicoccus sp.]|uniref:Uncharacterized protein n=1 Tax=metagenome TaxID=256318 RepID=A0A380TBL0_9ZZZZ|nr:hypothetical protein DF3PB_1520007 [uncultured Defluviicoccus sp.]